MVARPGLIDDEQSPTTWLDACFVADRALTERLPLRELVDPKQKSPAGSNRPSRRLRVRDSGSLRSSGVVLVFVVGVPLGALVGRLALGVFAAMARS